MRLHVLFLVASAIANLPGIGAFQSLQTHARTNQACKFSAMEPKRKGTLLLDKAQQEDEEEIEVGSKEYYSGFLSSPIQDETVAERGSGLEQALKLGGGVVLVLVVLFAGFMASNGLI